MTDDNYLKQVFVVKVWGGRIEKDELKNTLKQIFLLNKKDLTLN